MKCLVLNAKKYSFVDEATGEVKSGMHVTYIDPLMREDSNMQKGDLVMKVPALESNFEKLNNIPGFYELDFRQRPDAKGRPVLTLADVKFIEKVNFLPQPGHIKTA